jgi:hypothetical protein
MNLLDTGQKHAIANNFAASTMVLHENKHNKIDETIRIKKQPPDKPENVPPGQKKTKSSKFKSILNLFSKDKNSDLMNSAKPPGLFERNIRTTSITSKNGDFRPDGGKNYSENYPDKYSLESSKASHQSLSSQHSPNPHSPNLPNHYSPHQHSYHHHRDEKSTMSGCGYSSGVGTCDHHTVDEDNSSMNNSSIEDKKINEGSSSNGYGSYVSNSSRNASVSSVGNQSEKRSYSYHKPTRIVDEKFGRTMVEKKERIYQKNSCGTDEYSTADSNSKRCTGRVGEKVKMN